MRPPLARARPSGSLGAVLTLTPSAFLLSRLLAAVCGGNRHHEGGAACCTPPQVQRPWGPTGLPRVRGWLGPRGLWGRPLSPEDAKIYPPTRDPRLAGGRQVL